MKNVVNIATTRRKFVYQAGSLLGIALWSGVITFDKAAAWELREKCRSRIMQNIFPVTGLVIGPFLIL